MQYNFDFKDFQKESMKKLSQIYLEAMMDQEEVIDQDPIYEKMQKILKCKEMEKCHPFIFSLDRGNINETEYNKINELYECGLKRGFLTEDEPEFEPEETDDTFCGGPEDSLTNQEFLDKPKIDDNIQKPIYTIFYTATQNDEQKNGEFYSSIIDKEEAKKDCISQLSDMGYTSIQIKAVEQTDEQAFSQYPTNDIADKTEDEMVFNEDDSEEYEKQETGEIDEPESTELTVDEKNALKTEYIRVFKEIINEEGKNKSFSEMFIDEKIKFLTELSEKWNKTDPINFMDLTDQEKLDNYIPEKNEEESEKGDEE